MSVLAAISMTSKSRRWILKDRPMGQEDLFVGWLVACLTSQQHASVSHGRTCSDNVTCCHTEIEVADPTFRLTQSQYTGTWPASPSTDPITLGAWQGSHWSANIEVTGMTRPRKNPGARRRRRRRMGRETEMTQAGIKMKQINRVS